MSLSLKQLQQAALSCGLSSAGTKLSILEKLCKLHTQIKDVDRIISIDMGTKNLAFCEMTGDLQVKRLRLVDLNLPEPFEPTSFVSKIRQFLADELPFTNDTSSATYLIERQRCRTMGSRAIPESILRVNFVEILLHFHLHGRAIPVSPERVATHFQLPRGRPKKQAAVGLVKGYLESKQIRMDQETRSFYAESKKQDDLSDCLLQGFAFFQWQNQCQAFSDSLKGDLIKFYCKEIATTA